VQVIVPDPLSEANAQQQVGQEIIAALIGDDRLSHDDRACMPP